MGGAVAKRRVDVLVVDDSQLDRAVIRDVLSGKGLVVQSVDGPSDAESALRTSTPGVVLTDLVMPAGGGLRVCRAVASLGATRPHLVVVSASEDGGSLVSALEAGADDYLRKPVDADELLARVRVGMRTHAARVEADRAAIAVRAREAETRGVLTSPMTPSGVMTARPSVMASNRGPSRVRALRSARRKPPTARWSSSSSGYLRRG